MKETIEKFNMLGMSVKEAAKVMAKLGETRFLQEIDAEWLRENPFEEKEEQKEPKTLVDWFNE
jgi:hypothetical protein